MKSEKEITNKLNELKDNLDDQTQIDMIEQIAQIQILEWILEVHK